MIPSLQCSVFGIGIKPQLLAENREHVTNVMSGEYDVNDCAFLC